MKKKLSKFLRENGFEAVYTKMYWQTGLDMLSCTILKNTNVIYDPSLLKVDTFVRSQFQGYESN